MRLMIVLLLFLSLTISKEVNAELVYNGVPSNVGDEVANATADLLDAIAWFYGSLQAWERRFSDNQAVQLEDRIARSQQNFVEFVGRLKNAIASFNELLGSSNQDVQSGLDEELSGDPQSLPGGIEPAQVLEENGYDVPETYRNVVEIALSEAERLWAASGEGFISDADAYRRIAFQIHEAVGKTVLVGFAVAEFVPGSS